MKERALLRSCGIDDVFSRAADQEELLTWILGLAEAGVGRITRSTTRCARSPGKLCKSKVSGKKIKRYGRFSLAALSVRGVLVVNGSSYQRI